MIKVLKCISCDSKFVATDGVVFACGSCGARNDMAKEVSGFLGSKVALVAANGIAVQA